MSDNDRDSVKGARQKQYDHFWLQSVFPDVNAAFLLQQRAVTEIKGNCLVILDANVLLMPYELGARSPTEIIRVYRMLVDESRLFVPGQAARESLKNRGNKVRDIVREISNQVSRIQLPFDKSIGFLDSDERFITLKKLSSEITELKKKITSEAEALRSSLSDRIGGDPVSIAYQGLFQNALVELPNSEQIRGELVEELHWRFKHDIPPGYQDSTKPDGGIGDYLIWKTILKIGTERKLDCIFVTKDAKGDWWVQSEGAFQPRVELIEEYRRASEGRSIHLMPLSDLMVTFDAQKEVIDDARRVEEPPPLAARKLLAKSRVTHTSDENNLENMPIYALHALDRLEKDRFGHLVRQHSKLESALGSSEKMDEAGLEALYREKAAVWEDMNGITRKRMRIKAEIEKRLATD